MNITIMYRLVLLMLCIVPNIIGAGLMIAYFRYFNLSALLPQTTPMQAFNTIILGLTVMSVVYICAELYARRVLSLDSRIRQSKNSPYLRQKLSRLVLNAPFYAIIFTLCGWFTGGIGTAILLTTSGTPYHQSLIACAVITLIGGSISIAFTFSVADTLNRFPVKKLLHDPDYVVNSTGVVRIGLLFRLVFAFSDWWNITGHPGRIFFGILCPAYSGR
jgi:hypothetical protein